MRKITPDLDPDSGFGSAAERADVTGKFSHHSGMLAADETYAALASARATSETKNV
jgi:hypothetical protein